MINKIRLRKFLSELKIGIKLGLYAAAKTCNFMIWFYVGVVILNSYGFNFPIYWLGLTLFGCCVGIFIASFDEYEVLLK